MPSVNEREHLDKVAKYFDEDAKRYESARYALSHRDCHQYSYSVRKSIVLNLLRESGGQILDIGCGPGIYTADLVARGFTVHGCDLSQNMIDAARAKYADAIYLGRASFSKGEIYDIGTEAKSFDAILGIGIVSYVPDLERFLRAAHCLLKPEGLLIVQISKRWSPKAFDEKFVIPLLRRIRSGVSRRHVEPEWEFPMFRYNVGQFNATCARAGFEYEAGIHFDYSLPFISLLSKSASLAIARPLEQKRISLMQVLLAGDFVGRYRKLS